MIVDPDGEGLDSHWQKTAFALLVGVILHALYKARNEGGTVTLPSVDSMLADPHRDIGELWMEMTTYQHMDSQNHHAIGVAARDMMNRSEVEARSVLATARSYLAVANIAMQDEPLGRPAAGREAVREKMTDALTPGFQVEFDPDEAERAGAFVEDALSEQDATASGEDLI